jgi:hypothetical protein
LAVVIFYLCSDLAGTATVPGPQSARYPLGEVSSLLYGEKATYAPETLPGGARRDEVYEEGQHE